MGMLQRAVRIIMPPQCGLCGSFTEGDGGLCATCWREAEFASGTVCECCGTVLPGTDDGPVLCDECLRVTRNWKNGRTAMRYAGAGRKLVLALKHGDRLDLVPVLGRMMAQVARPLLQTDTVIVPVPLHWTRLLRRRYNQSAVLAQEVGHLVGRPVSVDGLIRIRRTPPTEGMSREDRLLNQLDSIQPHPRRGGRLRGRHVLIIDDVMTTGATLSAATDGAFRAGAREVSVLTLARAAKDA